MALDAVKFMRPGTRGSPSWPGARPRGRIRWRRLISSACTNPLRTGRAIRFKVVQCGLVLSVMPRPSRQLAEAQLADLAADRRLVQADAELLVNPPGEVLEPPADHAVDGRDRPAFQHPGQSLTLVVVQLRALSRRLAANQASRTLSVERQNPIPNGLEPDAPDPRRIRPPAAVIDLRKGQKTTPLRRVLRCLRLTPQTSGIEISSQR